MATMEKALYTFFEKLSIFSGIPEKELHVLFNNTINQYSDTCIYLHTSGRMSGRKCSAKSEIGTNYCADHTRTPTTGGLKRITGEKSSDLVIEENEVFEW